MKLKDIWSMLKDVFSEWNADKAPRLGAALSYYSVFSLAPVVIIAVGIAGLVFGEEAARGGIVREIESTVGEPAAKAIEEMVKNTHQNGQSQLATAVGLVVLLFGASGVFVELQDALNTIWKVKPRPDRGLWDIVRERFLSFAIVLGSGFLLLVSLSVTAALTALGNWLTSLALPGGPILWQGINTVVSVAFITLLFGLISFKLLPDVKIAWRDVWTGAIVTALLFTLGKYLIGLYLGQSGTASAFGAAAALVLILLWVYYSSQIVLFGAEFTRIYTTRFGSHVVPTDNAVVVTQDERARQGMARAGESPTAGRVPAARS